MVLGWKTRLFPQTRMGKTTKSCFLPEAHAPRGWIDAGARPCIFCTPHTRLHSLVVCFRFCLRLFSVFFDETYLWTWNIIYPLCNVFIGLLNLHSQSFNILLRCFALPICMILQIYMTQNENVTKYPKNHRQLL